MASYVKAMRQRQRRQVGLVMFEDPLQEGEKGEKREREKKKKQATIERKWIQSLSEPETTCTG